MNYILLRPILVLSILILTLGCNKKKVVDKNITINKVDSIEAILITTKYCKMYYSNLKKDGVNIYFAGWIINNTSDTLYVLNNNDSITYVRDLEESLFYSIIKNDTLKFLSYWTVPPIKPYDSITLELQRHISPQEKKWIKIFKNIEKNQQVLDTMKIRYATPKVDNNLNILPPITFRHSSKFRIDTASYNSYFEGIFQYSDYLEDSIPDTD